MAVSFCPNWFGQRQVRLVELKGERLQLSIPEPQRIHGTLKMATLIQAMRVLKVIQTA